MSHVEQQSKIFTLLKWYHDRGIVYLPPQEKIEPVETIENDAIWFLYETGQALQANASLELLNNIAKALRVETQVKIYALEQIPDLSLNSASLPRSLLLFGAKALNLLAPPDTTGSSERFCSFFILKPWNIPTLLLESPAAMIQNPQLKAPAWKALQGFMKFLESRE